MASAFLAKFADCMPVKVVLLKRVSVERERLELYAQMPSEEFNAVVANHIVSLRTQHGFEASEHENWVYPALSYKRKEGGGTISIHPLNSWILKNPVSFVPSAKRIREQYDWYQEYVLRSKNKKAPRATAEEMQETYIQNACEEISQFSENLIAWRRGGMPREQEECAAGLSHQQIKKVQTLQECNVRSAKDVMDGFKSLYAPWFISVAATAVHARECAVLDQLKEAMRYP